MWSSAGAAVRRPNLLLVTHQCELPAGSQEYPATGQGVPFDSGDLLVTTTKTYSNVA